jgi:O-acetyl-ADP-ribose deacetylase (regulator of RNase III)
MMNQNISSGFYEDSTLIARGVYKNATVEIYLKSVLSLNTIALVNAANNRLEHAGGLAAQIAYEAGDDFTRACSGRTPTITFKKPFVTDAFNLRSKGFQYIYNVVGPIVEQNYMKNHHDRLLVECIQGLLEYADNQKVTSIAVPAISCGIYGFPIAPGSKCHIEGFFQFADNKPKNLQLVKFGLFKEEEAKEFRDAFLEKREKFTGFEFFDIPRNRSNPFFRFCGGCSSILSLDFFSLLSCNCKVYCNFCVSRYKLAYCLTCRLSEAQINNEKSIWCRECLKEIHLSKKSKSKICQNCRNICFLHSRSQHPQPCPYCTSPLPTL